MLHVCYGTLHTVGHITIFFKMTENFSNHAHCVAKSKVILEGCVSWPLGPRGQLTQPSRTTLAKSVGVCFCVNHVGFFLGFFLTTSRLQDISNIMTYYFGLLSFIFFFRIIQRLGFFLEISVILYSLIPSFIIMNNRTIIIIINQFFGSRRARSYGVAF